MLYSIEDKTIESLNVVASSTGYTTSGGDVAGINSYFDPQNPDHAYLEYVKSDGVIERFKLAVDTRPGFNLYVIHHDTINPSGITLNSREKIISSISLSGNDYAFITSEGNLILATLVENNGVFT